MICRHSLNWLAAGLVGFVGCSAFGAFTVLQKGTDYKIAVDANTVDGTSTLVLAWDTEDKGETLANWSNTRVITSSLPVAGGDFYTPIEGIPDGSSVRAFATRTYTLLEDGGYVQLSDNRYFCTDVKENEACGVEAKFTMVSGDTWCPIIAGTHDKFCIGKYVNNNASIWLRCHDGNQICASTGINNGGANTVSLRRDTSNAKKCIFLVNGTQRATQTYSEDFVLYKGASNCIRLDTSANQSNFTRCRWYYVQFWDLTDTLVRDYVPVKCVESGAAMLYDTINGKGLISRGSGSCSYSGTLSETNETETLAVSPVATAVDPFYIVKASWTGAADNGYVHDPLNWACTNLLDEVVEGVLPGTGAVITVSGNIDMDIAEGLVLTGKSITVSATFTNDVSWLGHIQTAAGTDVLPSGTTFEMNGHNFTLTGAFYGEKNSLVIKNSVSGDPALLTIDTPAGTECKNTGSYMQKNLRFQKTGAGTFWAYNKNSSNSYWGGTALLGGTTKLIAGANNWAFGGSMKGLLVGAGAVLDTRGQYHICDEPITLAGGTIRNSIAMGNQTADGFGNITLTADSTFEAQENTVLTVGSTLSQQTGWRCRFMLNGHTITINVGSGKYLDFGCVDFVNGKVKITGAGRFRTDNNSYQRISGETADFDVTAQWMELYRPVSTHDFTCRVTGSESYGNSTVPVSVYGMFRPVTDKFPKTVLMDGAGLSLVDKTGTWTPVNTRSDKAHLTFPTDGTVTVDVTGRTDLLALAKSASPYLVKWNDGEIPSTTTFVMKGLPKGYSVQNNSTGLHITQPMCIIIIR